MADRKYGCLNQPSALSSFQHFLGDNGELSFLGLLGVFFGVKERERFGLSVEGKIAIIENVKTVE